MHDGARQSGQKAPGARAQESAARHSRVESALNGLLAVTVLASAAISAVGAVLYLRTRGHEAVSFSEFHAQPDHLRLPAAIIEGAAHLEPGAIIQLGVLLLVLTPVARVAFSMVLFLLRRDRMYVLITLAVLAALLAGLLGGLG